MRLTLRIPVSIVGSIFSAGIGWLIAALIGTLMMHDRSFDGLGAGVLMALLLYVLAFIFGVAGFILCMVLLSKRRTPIPK
jgi:hypothetical protein